LKFFLFPSKSLGKKRRPPAPSPRPVCLVGNLFQFYHFSEKIQEHLRKPQWHNSHNRRESINIYYIAYGFFILCLFLFSSFYFVDHHSCFSFELPLLLELFPTQYLFALFSLKSLCSFYLFHNFAI
jgi:hypothetical protein